MLWGDGSPTREFLYVDDCVDGLVLAAERYDGPEPVNLGAAREISIRELAELIADVVGYEGAIVWDTEKPNGQPRTKRRRDTGPRAVRVRGEDLAARGDRAHRRVVPLGGRGCRYELQRSARRARAGSTVDRLLERPRAVSATLIVGQISPSSALALSVAAQRLGVVPGRRPDLDDDDRLAARASESSRRRRSAISGPPLQAPITWATGPTYVQALPALVVAQVLVLGPIALLCVYGIAAQIGGRLLGYWAALLWVIAPFAAIPLFVDRYHERWTEQFLPQALGLTAMADFPSMVLVLAGALFVVRSLAPGRVPDAVLAGILIGAAAALKPPNLLVAGGALLAYVVARRWREGMACGVAIAPALLVLLLLEGARAGSGSGVRPRARPGSRRDRDRSRST